MPVQIVEQAVKNIPENMRNCQIKLSLHVKMLQKKWICWNYVARKFGFVYLRFDPFHWNSLIV